MTLTVMPGALVRVYCSTGVPSFVLPKSLLVTPTLPWAAPDACCPAAAAARQQAPRAATATSPAHLRMVRLLGCMGPWPIVAVPGQSARGGGRVRAPMLVGAA